MELRLTTGRAEMPFQLPNRGLVGNRAENGELASAQRTVSSVGGNAQDAAVKRREPEKKSAQPLEREALPTWKRNLKFEFIADANMYQIHVIDRNDANVVRKIPSDAALSIIVHLKNQMQAALKAGEFREQLNIVA